MDEFTVNLMLAPSFLYLVLNRTTHIGKVSRQPARKASCQTLWAMHSIPSPSVPVVDWEPVSRQLPSLESLCTPLIGGQCGVTKHRRPNIWQREVTQGVVVWRLARVSESARHFGHVKSWPETDASEVRVQGFAGWKAGMTHVMARDLNPKSNSAGQEIRIPVTVVEVPKMRVLGVRGYKMTPYGKQAAGEAWVDAEQISKNIPSVV